MSEAEEIAPEVLAQLEPCADSTSLALSAFGAQEILFEFLAKYMQFSNPADLGFKFRSRYNIDPTKSDILLEHAHDWKTQTAGKRPAVFVSRSAVDISAPTMGGVLDYEDETMTPTRITMNRMMLQVTVVAAPLGVTEGIAEWITQGLTSFQQEIQQSFRFRRFKVKSMSQVQKTNEAKDMFAVTVQIEVAFDAGTVITRDEVKLRRVALTVFDAVTGNLWQ